MSIDNIHTVTFSHTGAVYTCFCSKKVDHLASQMSPEEVLENFFKDRTPLIPQEEDDFEKLPLDIQMQIETDMVRGLQNYGPMSHFQHQCVVMSGRCYPCYCHFGRNHNYEEATKR